FDISNNAQSVVTYTFISSDSDGLSWGIPLMNANEFLEMDPNEERRFAFTAPLPGCDIAESYAAAAKVPRGQYDFVDTVEEGNGLIRSPGQDARTIARVANRAEDVGYVKADTNGLESSNLSKRFLKVYALFLTISAHYQMRLIFQHTSQFI
nr:hypothetical protein [Tanacetum cinerariifolium]